MPSMRECDGGPVNPVTILSVLDRKTRLTLRRAGERAVESIASRDWYIREASRNGATLREIAEAVGLSHVGVKKIIDREVTDVE